jgi:dTDP-glucose 4,6-dehydratase
VSSLKTAATVLVTGADGFIGSHLTETLVRQGYKVRAFVYYNSFNSWKFSQVTLGIPMG